MGDEASHFGEVGRVCRALRGPSLVTPSQALSRVTHAFLDALRGGIPMSVLWCGVNILLCRQSQRFHVMIIISSRR